MRIGIFGGSFDPVHYGHLLLAECCRETCQLDQVWFLPTSVSPYKKHHTPAPARARIEMLQLAVGGHEPFVVSTLETDRGGVSYTVDTLQAIRDAQPSDNLFLLLGADALLDLPHWREPERICALASPVVVGRAGASEPDMSRLAGVVSPERLSELSGYQVHMPRVELSSSDVRQRVAAGQSIRFRTPRAVEMYIEANKLYRNCENV